MNKRAAAALRRNMRDVAEHGPRLSYNRSTVIVATCRAEGKALLTGLGAMGVGSMWVELEGDYIKRARRDQAPDFATIDEANAWWHREVWGPPLVWPS